MEGKSVICPRCKKTFVCGAGTGSCWCMELRINAASFEKLKKQYKDCLCKDCLETIDEWLDKTKNEKKSEKNLQVTK